MINRNIIVLGFVSFFTDMASSIVTVKNMFKKKIWSMIIIFLTTISLQAKDNIEVYHAYGNAHHVIVQGRMLHKKEFTKVSSDDGWFRNLWRRAKQIESDEISDAKIVANIQGEKFSVKSDDEGYFEFNITVTKILKTGYIDMNLTIENNNYPKHILVTIIGNQKLMGIISDFDDTIIISDVTNKIKLANNTLFKNYKQREVVSGMVNRFNEILAQNHKDIPSTLFILSGSPQQLFIPVEAFLKYHNFPKYTLILKKAHGANKDPLTDQFAYKTQKIERLIKLYPHIEWVMFGDSGEKDKEVYQFIKKKYPSNVKAYYIQDVDSGEIRVF